jgi:hypothetical protein
MHIRQIWRRLTTTRYARTLEAELGVERTVVALQDAEINRQAAEIARLRDENRAMLNSILGIAGVPPLPVTEPDLVGMLPFSGTGTLACALLDDTQHDRAPSPVPARPPSTAHATNQPRHMPHVAAPMRRRSWPQINRLLEFESAQKEKPATEPLPPAHQ